MIDNPDYVDRLFDKLNAVLPLPARMSPQLVECLRPQTAIASSMCSVQSVSYGGDEGGVMCELDLQNDDGKAVYVSITHLRFDPRLPAARDIAAYQKHRIKNIRRYG